MKCKNCGNEFEGKFCNLCAQSASVGKFTSKNLLEELSANIFQINHGFFYTLKYLFIRPGHLIREYLEGKRKKYFKPITYVLVVSTVYFVLNKIFETDNIVDDAIQGQMTAYSERDKDANDLSFMQWFSNNFAYTILLLIPFFSFATYLTFINRGRNFIEHIVINTFISGQQLIFWIVALLIEVIAGPNDFFELFAFFIAFSFKFWTYIQFFKDHNKFITGLQLILSYVIFLVLITIINGLLIFIMI